MKRSKITLSKDLNVNIVNKFKNNISALNAVALLRIVNLFKLPRLDAPVLNRIEACFTVASALPSFLELDFKLVMKILSSSQLSVTSEAEVFAAADAWIAHSLQSRIEHAKDLLSTVRLQLLSHSVLMIVFNKSLAFKNDKRCLGMVKSHKKSSGFYGSKTCSPQTNRFCSHFSFEVLACAGSNKHIGAIFRLKIKPEGQKNTNVLTFRAAKTNKLYRTKAACLKGCVYFFDEHNANNKFVSVQRLTHGNLTSHKVASIKVKRSQFSVCGLMDKVYVIGGLENHVSHTAVNFNWKASTSSCIEFNTKNHEYKKVPKMNDQRASAASAVFKGRVVVTGGFAGSRSKPELLNTAEYYDHASGVWSRMPDMVQRRCCHRLVPVRNKIFVVGGRDRTTCEAFDGVARKFVLLKETARAFEADGVNTFSHAFLFGSKLLVIGSATSKALFYDTETGKCSKVGLAGIDDVSRYCCVQVPILNY